MKCGKTSNCLQIPDSLMINVEESAEYYGGQYLNVKELCRKHNKGPVTVMNNILESIRNKNKEVKGYAYRRIVIDQLTDLEEIALRAATHAYKQTPQGKDYMGTDVTELDFGKGYGLLREAMDSFINPFKELCETLVLLGHPKTSYVNRGGESLQVTDLNVTGKLAKSIPGGTDANAVMYRDESGLRNILSFVNRGNDNLTGSRVERLANKEFVISEVIDGKLITHWDQIFIN